MELSPETPDPFSFRNNKNILCVCERSKNANLVLYESKLSDNNTICDTPVDIYWWSIDPNSVKNFQKKNKPLYRDELSILERKFVYGINVESVDIIGESVVYKITSVAFPKKPIKLSYNKKNKYAIATVTLNGKFCYLKKMFVYSTENVVGWPTVHYIDIFGTELSSRIEIFERIIP